MQSNAGISVLSERESTMYLIYTLNIYMRGTLTISNIV